MARNRSRSEHRGRDWSLHEDIDYLDWLARLSAGAQPVRVMAHAGHIVEFCCALCGERRTTSTLWGVPPSCCGHEMAGHVVSYAGGDVWP